MNKIVVSFCTLCLILSACTPQTESPHLEAGRQAYSSQQYSLALQEFKLAIEEQPGSPESYVLAADLLIRKNSLDEALQILKLGEQNVSDKSAIELRMAEVYRWQHDYATARTYFERVVDYNNEDSQRARDGLVRVLALLGDIDALTRVAEGISLTDSQEILLVKAFVLRETQAGTDAVNAIKEGPTDSLKQVATEMETQFQALQGEGALFAKARLAHIMITQGWPEVSKPLLDNMINENAYYETPYLYRGLIYRTEKEYDKAIADFNSVITLLPESKDARIFLIQTLLDSGNSTKATEELTPLLQLGSLTAEQQELLTRQFILAENYDGAATVLSKLDHATFTTRLKLYEIRVQIHKGEFAPALEATKALLDFEQNPDAELLAWAAEVYAKNDDNAKASELLTEAKALDRNNPWIYLFEGEILIASESYGEAREALERAVDLDLEGQVSQQAQLLLQQL